MVFPDKSASGKRLVIICIALISSRLHNAQAIFELINTEAAYVRDLQLIVEVYYPTSTYFPPSLISPRAGILQEYFAHAQCKGDNCNLCEHRRHFVG